MLCSSYFPPAGVSTRSCTYVLHKHFWCLPVLLSYYCSQTFQLHRVCFGIKSVFTNNFVAIDIQRGPRVGNTPLPAPGLGLGIFLNYPVGCSKQFETCGETSRNMVNRGYFFNHLIHTAVHLLHTAVHLLHTTVHLLHTTVHLLHTTVDLLHTTVHLLHTTVHLLHTTVNLLHTAIHLLHTTLHLLHTTVHLLHTAVHFLIYKLIKIS